MAGDLSDNDSTVLLEHKDEFLSICDKILRGSTEETLRLGAWNMRAKILHAENKTGEALEIYKTKFADWYNTSGQKEEQLFAKGTEEYYHCVQKNMYELANFAADKLGRTIMFNKTYSLEEKVSKALKYSDCLTAIFEETGDLFFLVLARSLLGRMENDLVYRGGKDADIILIMERYLHVTKTSENEDLLQQNVNDRLHATKGRRAQLLKNPAYTEVLSKYK